MVTSCAGEHQCLVEVGDGPERACFLFFKDQARLREPVVCFIKAAVQGAQAGNRQPQIHHREPEVGGKRLEAQGSLDRL
jgi:hypothetical protein